VDEDRAGDSQIIVAGERTPRIRRQASGAGLPASTKCVHSSGDKSASSRKGGMRKVKTRFIQGKEAIEMKRYKLLASVMCLALTLSACVPVGMAPPEEVAQPAAEIESARQAGPAEETSTETASPPEPHGLRPDAPPYAVRGPYPVGTRNYTIEDGDHTVEAVIWYPALNPSNAPEEITYAVSPAHPDIAGLPIKGHAIQDAAPDMTHGAYPLVIMSGGLTAWSQAYSYLCEHLASQGFVVMSSDARGETSEEFWEGAATRILDTNRLIAHADELTSADGDLPGFIDTEHIAVMGHSSGGWTALVQGGAQFDWGWCRANPDIVAENELSNCTQFVPHQEEVAALLGLEAAPAGLWPQMNDPRVDAVIAMAPDGDIWGDNYEGVASVKAPTLVMSGTGDTVNIPERCAYPVYEHLGSDSKRLITFDNANHMLFANQCRDSDWLPFEWCSDAAWDMDRAHDLINHFATAFLMAELKGDAEAAAALKTVSFPGVEYRSQG
jgi:predicted dienelactone hydrolase